MDRFGLGTNACWVLRRGSVTDSERRAIERLERGAGTRVDVRLLAPLAAMTGLPWLTLFPHIEEDRHRADQVLNIFRAFQRWLDKTSTRQIVLNRESCVAVLGHQVREPHKGSDLIDACAQAATVFIAEEADDDEP